MTVKKSNKKIQFCDKIFCACFALLATHEFGSENYNKKGAKI
jgi:hypothetical protein